MRPLVLIALPLLGLAEGAAAQAPGDAPPRDCTYASCALRLSGRTIYAGQEGREVGSFGFFAAPPLRPLVELSDSASHYFAIVENNHRSGRIMSFAGTGMVYLAWGLLRAWDHRTFQTSDWITLGVGVAGMAGSIVGYRRTHRARDALTKSIWWYNAALANPPS